MLRNGVDDQNPINAITQSICNKLNVEHFKKLNTNDSKSDEGDVTDNTNIDNLNVELSKPFEPDEVKKSIILSNVFKSEIGGQTR